MKTPNDPRHKRRQDLIQELFRNDFHPQKISEKAQHIVHSQTLLDEKIASAAPEFPVDKINKVDLSILRLAVYELLIEKKVPANVIIDEAVELAKEFAGETSPGFINGVLGNIISNEKPSEI